MKVVFSVLFIFCLRTYYFSGSTVLAECIYENTRYSEGSSVPTIEPCLRCACAKNTLLCYLRVCPELPDPPPLGCLILHKHRTCCPELICADLPHGNKIEARYEPDALEIPYNHSIVGHGCVHNGTLYGSGSAMQTSSLCEYCYCINGKEHCVKPKCLLPVPGCKPLYASHSCCPTHYKCRNDERKTTRITTTTTAATLSDYNKKNFNNGECLVSGQRYPEGGKILGIGHSPCDNCYCMRGVVRCVPLQCAPPLLGCTPVVPPGECCAASYNCSGIIEVQPAQNFGSKPVVSKEYAQLRKEVQNSKGFSNNYNNNQQLNNSNNPHYIIAESLHQNDFKKVLQKPSSTPYYFTSTAIPFSTFIPSRQIFATTKHLPVNSNPQPPENISKYSKISLTTTRISNDSKISTISNQGSTMPMHPIFKPSKLVAQSKTTAISPIYYNNAATTTKQHETTTENNVYKMSLNYIDTDNDYSTIDGRNNRRIDDQNTETTFGDNITTTEIYTTETSETLSTETSTVITTDITTTEGFEVVNFTNSELLIGNNTNCIDNSVTIKNDQQKIEERIDEFETTTENFSTTMTTFTDLSTTTEIFSTTEIFDETSTKTENILATVGPFKKLIPDIETILNITKSINKKDNDYEYDYNEPSLPPSLPNLKIIPFVAADAVVEEKENPVILNQENHRATENPLYTYTLNFFSPPIETEGGFVPRDPPAPLLNSFYENTYHTTGIIDITSGTGTNVPAITNPPKTKDDNCLVDGKEIRHGELISETGACSICLCLFGDIVCQPPKCPPVPSGCRRTQSDSLPPVCCGHVVCNGNEEAPTVVLDRIDVTSDPQEDLQSDPFRDVIRTEPAPDLQSLIGDIMPYLVRQTTTLKPTTHMTTTKTNTDPQIIITTDKTNEMEAETKLDDENEFSLDTVFKLLFSNDQTTDKTTTNLKNTMQTTTESAKNVTFSSSTSSTSASVVPSSTTTTNAPFSNSNSWYLSTKSQNENPNRNSIENSVGLLKLAGCNIYGRMYRVGRIISELSGPCLECMCTEIGVQCRPLNC